MVPDATDATWAKVRFGGSAGPGWPQVLPELRDGPVLVVVDNAIRDAVRDGDLDPGRGAGPGLCTASCRGSTPSAGHRPCCGFAASDQLAGAYAPVADAPARLAGCRRLREVLLAASPAGSDRQLAAFRLAVRSATDAGLLRRLVQGRALPAGDGARRRARPGGRRAARRAGRRPRGDRQALARRRVLVGDVHAARARASSASAEAKEAAWRDC